MNPTKKQRIWGWYFFDWATQPFYTLGLTFIFGPYFAEIAVQVLSSQGAAEPNAQAQSIWFMGQTIAGLLIAATAPFLGIWADNQGRKIPWLLFFSFVFIVATWSLWGLAPGGTNLIWYLVIFYIGFFAAESSLNFTNAFLPALGTKEEIGKISGTGASFGYWGGVLALFLMLLIFAEDKEGLTLLKNPPAFGLNGTEREGTRLVGPFIAVWFAIFMIPFFMWTRDDPNAVTRRTSISSIAKELKTTTSRVFHNKSLGFFLLGSMFYRDALNALYTSGGIYAKLVLGWTVIDIGVFGVIAAIAAAIVTWLAGMADQRFGPKPVIRAAIWLLLIVCTIIIGMTRTSIFGMPIPEGSLLPDIIFYVCGAIIGGAGGALYSASRSLMVRHADPERATEAFGLFALSGKATAFVAPALITLLTTATGSNQLGFAPLIVLFVAGLFVLRWVNPNGDAEAWSEPSSSS